MRFTMTVLGVDVIDAAILGTREAIEDFRPVWPEMGEWMEQKLFQRFESQGVADGGTEWAPLKSEAYKRWKARHYPSSVGKLLVRSFRLRASLTNAGNALAGDAIREYSFPRRFEFGTAVPYAAYLNSGAGPTPPRTIFLFSADSKKKAMKILHQYINRVRTDRRREKGKA